jgi:hypothetical protein
MGNRVRMSPLAAKTRLASNKKRRAGKKRLTDVDFAIPRQITDEGFSLLCVTYDFPKQDQPDLRTFLDELVREFGIAMDYERRQPDRPFDRDRLEKALESAGSIAKLIEKLGPHGRRATRAFSKSFSPMLSAQWLNENFVDDAYAPQRSRLPTNSGGRSPEHRPERDSEYFIEEESLRARLEFVEHRPVETFIALFREIQRGLKEALRSLALQPRSRGGQKPLVYRSDLIVNLAEIWTALGRNVVTSTTSDFAAFCEQVAVSIGWPDQGMAAAIPDAVKNWRNLPRNFRRSSK